MKMLAAPLYAMSSTVLLAIALAFTFGGLDGRLAGISLAFGGMVAAFTFWRARDQSAHRRSLKGWEWASIFLFSLFALRAFLWLIRYQQDELVVMSPNNLGDMSLHLTYINQLAAGASFWPDNPIVAGAKLTYPLGVDLLNSLLTLVGFDTVRGLVWVGLLGIALTGFSVWRWGGAFTLAGLLCNGGLAGFVALRTGLFLDYQSDLAWKSIPLALLVTQRGFLFALPAGLLLLVSWRTRYFPESVRPNSQPLPRWGELLLYASMPVFHLHTFLFLSLVLLTWFLLFPETRPRLIRFVLLALVPAAVLVFLGTGSFGGPSVVAPHFGWMQNEPEFIQMCLDQHGTDSPWFTIPFFWALNFGILPLFVSALSVIILARQGNRWERAALVPALLTFGLCLFFRFAPWAWDNTKLMIWSYLAVLPLIWSVILVRWPVWLRAVCCFGLFWSGFASLLGGLNRTQTGFSIATRSELDALAPALHSIPISERFIAHPNYNHPLLLLGRAVALGYPGHVWSHGYPYVKAEERVETVLRGLPDWEAAWPKTGAHLLFWGSQEREAYPDSSQPWRETARLIASGTWGEIYDLSAPAESKAKLQPEQPDPQPPAPASSNDLPAAEPETPPQ